MRIINNEGEFEEFYYYKNSQPDEYPQKYPCIVEHVSYDYGGLSERIEHRIFYIPDDVDPKTYLRGMIAYKGIIMMGY